MKDIDLRHLAHLIVQHTASKPAMLFFVKGEDIVGRRCHPGGGRQEGFVVGLNRRGHLGAVASENVGRGWVC